MNRKDLDLLARAVKAGWPPDDIGGTAGRLVAANCLALTLSKECAGFDLAKFKQRCGVKDAG